MRRRRRAKKKVDGVCEEVKDGGKNQLTFYPLFFSNRPSRARLRPFFLSFSCSAWHTNDLCSSPVHPERANIEAFLIAPSNFLDVLSCIKKKKKTSASILTMARTAADLNLSVLKRLDGDIQEVSSFLYRGIKDWIDPFLGENAA